MMIPPTFDPTFHGRYHLHSLLGDIETRDIDGAELKGGGFLALPDGHGTHPGVIVIHEAYGLNENIKGITRRFAEEGYVALGVDLLSDRNRATAWPDTWARCCLVR